jgi:23S rRNA (cytosine1962-C5)-methyltransferase
METTTIHLKKGREKPVLNRHPWVFSGAIRKIDGRPQPGDLVDLTAADGRWLARAYYNPHSQIRARILSWDADEPLDDDFWAAKMRRAIYGRQLLELEPHTTAYRLINGEADGLPGLIVDKYGDYLVVQCLTLGIDQRKEQLVPLLVELVGEMIAPVKGVVERSDVSVRAHEGLTEIAGMLQGERPPDDLIVSENGRQFHANLLEGHKTGLYLDQRENRARLGQTPTMGGHEVLNLFAYTGGFAVYAAAAGAKKITNLDSSAEVMRQAQVNMALNGYERAQDEYIVADAFQALRQYRDSGRQFDVIILDPPKFAHNQADIERACRGYKDLNWLAFRLLRPGGLLATFSCSGLISADLFQKVVFGAVMDSGREGQIIHQFGQAADHPVLLTFPESAYLKGLLCRVW